MSTANQQPVFYDIEDYETGARYKIEAYEDDTTYDEAVEFFSTLNDNERQAYAVTTPAPDTPVVPEAVVQPEAPQPSAPSPSVTVEEGFGAVPAPVVATQDSQATAMSRLDQVMRGDPVEPLSQDQIDQYVGLVRDPSVSPEQIDAWLVESGNLPMSESALSQLETYRTALAEGKPTTNHVGFHSGARTLLGEFEPEHDEEMGSVLSSIMEGITNNPVSTPAAMWTKDVLDGTIGGIDKDDIRIHYPHLTDEEVERMHDDLIGERVRRLQQQDAYQVEQSGANPVTRFAGNLVGGISPLDAIPFSRGATFGRQLAEGAALNAAADVGQQGVEVSYGARGAYDPSQTFMSGVAGAALQGAFKGAEVSIDTGTQAVRNRRQTNQEVSTPEASISVPSSERGTRAYRREREQTVDSIVDHVNQVTQDWTNTPEISVYSSFATLKGVRNDGIGMFREDGTVAINADMIIQESARRNVSPESLVEQAVFHEALGHNALSQKYGQDLDDVLQDWLDNSNTELRSRVDNWMDENPSAYKKDANRELRALEEVLAESAEDSGILPVSLIDRVTNLVKDYGRRMGVNISYSTREVRSILANSQKMVTKGSPRADGNVGTTGGDRNMRARNKQELNEATEMMNAKDVLDNITRDYEPTFRSLDEAETAAREKGLRSRQYRSVKGLDDLDVRLFQYDNVATRMNNKLTNLYAKMQDGTWTMKDKEEYLKTLFRFQELSGKIFDDQAQIGRALNAMKQINLTKKRVTDLNEVLSEFQEGNGHLASLADDAVFNDMAEKINYMLATGNQAGATSMINGVLKPYWWQYGLTFRHAMMLSGMGTHVKNISDNALMIARELEEAALATSGFFGRKALNRFGIETKEGVSPQEVAGRVYGLLRALGDTNTYMNTKQAFMEGHGSTPFSAKIEMQDARIPFISKVNDFLYASDIFFRAFHMNANLYSLGVREARKDGFTGRAAFEEGSARAADPSPELMKQSLKLTDTALLVDAPSGLSSWAETGKAVKPGMTGEEQTRAFVFNMLFPFLRVSDRLVFQAIRRSPLSFLDKNTRREWEEGGAARDTAIARTMMGTALIAHYWSAAGTPDDTDGDIEGAIEYPKQAALETTGYRPNSVVEDGQMIDATALNLSFLPWGTQNNIATSIATLRSTWEKSQQDEEATNQLVNGMTAATASLLNLIGQQTYAENLDNTLKVVTETDPEARDRAWSNFVTGIGAQFMPAALRQYTQTVHDPIRRDTRGDGTFGDKFYGRMASAVPGLSDELPARRDALGRELEQGRTASGIGNYSEIRTGEVDQQLREVERSTDDVVLTGAPRRFQYQGENIKLTAAETEQWAIIQGQELNLIMEELVNDPEWVALPSEDKAEDIKEARRDAYQVAKGELMDQILNERGIE